jgi:hypothetical protein
MPHVYAVRHQMCHVYRISFALSAAQISSIVLFFVILAYRLARYDPVIRGTISFRLGSGHVSLPAPNSADQIRAEHVMERVRPRQDHGGLLAFV